MYVAATVDTVPLDLNLTLVHHSCVFFISNFLKLSSHLYLTHERTRKHKYSHERI